MAASPLSTFSAAVGNTRPPHPLPPTLASLTSAVNQVHAAESSPRMPSVAQLHEGHPSLSERSPLGLAFLPSGEPTAQEEMVEAARGLPVVWPEDECS